MMSSGLLLGEDRENDMKTRKEENREKEEGLNRPAMFLGLQKPNKQKERRRKVNKPEWQSPLNHDVFVVTIYIAGPNPTCLGAGGQRYKKTWPLPGHDWGPLTPF